jgi:hypothetical protein
MICGRMINERRTIDDMGIGKGTRINQRTPAPKPHTLHELISDRTQTFTLEGPCYFKTIINVDMKSDLGMKVIN